MKVTLELYRSFYSPENKDQELNLYSLFYKWRERMDYPVDFFDCWINDLSDEDLNEWIDEGIFMVSIPDNMMINTILPKYLNEDDLLDTCFESFQDYLYQEIPHFGFVLDRTKLGTLIFKRND